MANPVVLAPAAALPRIIRFDTAFETAMNGMRDQWHAPFTYTVNMDGNEAYARFPVLTNMAAFKLFDGVPNFRSLSEKFWDIAWKEYQDGVEAHINQIVLPTFRGWDREPANMAQAAMDLRVEGLGQMLMANPTLQMTGAAWFSHTTPQNPVNPVANQVNDNDLYSQTVGTAALDAIDTAFRGFKGPLQKPLRMRLTDLIVPTALYQAWNTILNPGEEFKNKGGTNKWRGMINLIHAPEIDFHANGTANTTTYFAVSRERGALPFAEARAKAWNGEEIETRYLDQNSDLFKNTGKLAISKIVKWNIVPAEPAFSIIRVSTAAE